MKQIKKGDTFEWKGHMVVVSVTTTDIDNGREIATIQPTGNYGFPIDIYLDKYGMELAK